MAKSVFSAFQGGSYPLSEGTTRYTACLGDISEYTTEAQANTVIRQTSGIISNLKTYVKANAGGFSTTVTTRKNAADTSVTVTYATGETGKKEDITNSFSVANSDEIDHKVVVGLFGTVQTIDFSIFYLEMDSDSTEPQSPLCIYGSPFTVSTDSTSWFGVGGSVDTMSTTETNAELRFLNPFDTTNLYGYCTSNARTTDTTVTVRKNGANGNQSITWTSGQTGAKEDTTNTDQFVSGDDFGLCLTTSTGGGNQIFSTFSVLSVPNTNYQFYNMVNARATGLSITTANYCYLGGETSTNTTSAAGSMDNSFSCTATNLKAYVRANTSAVAGTVELRLSGVASALSISYAGGETGLKTDTDTVSITTENLRMQDTENGVGSISLTYQALEIYTAREWYPNISTLVER